MQLISHRSLLSAIISLLLVDFSGAEDIVEYPNESQISSSPTWTTDSVCPNSHYLNMPGDTVTLQFVGIHIRIDFESTDAMLALISINNTDVATVINTTKSLTCTPFPWTSSTLPQGRHILRVTHMNDSNRVYIRRFSYISTTTDSESPKDELKCYGLPYGALGFLSHLLALYSFLCLINRRKPYFPFSRIKPGKYIYLDIILAAVTFIATVTLASITMTRCRNHWQYILLAVEILFLSIAISAISLSASLVTCSDTHAIVSYSCALLLFWAVL